MTDAVKVGKLTGYRTETLGLTPARREVLERCAAGPIRPVYTDWVAIYWLRDQKFVEERFPGKWSVTQAGRDLLARQEGGKLEASDG